MLPETVAGLAWEVWGPVVRRRAARLVRAPVRWPARDWPATQRRRQGTRAAACGGLGGFPGRRAQPIITILRPNTG